MNQTVIDSAVLRELQDTAGADFVAELADTFLEEAPPLLTELRSACEAGDADGFRRAAHTLKSNALTFGATTLGAAARALELAGLSTEKAHDLAAITALQAAYEDAAQALKALSHG